MARYRGLTLRVMGPGGPAMGSGKAELGERTAIGGQRGGGALGDGVRQAAGEPLDDI